MVWDDHVFKNSPANSKSVQKVHAQTHRVKGIDVTPEEAGERPSLYDDMQNGKCSNVARRHRRNVSLADLDDVIYTLEELEIYEEFDSKDFARSKKKRKNEQNPKDMKKQIRILRKRNEKLQGKLRAAGRAKVGYKRMIPESDEVSVKSDLPDGPVTKLIEQIGQQVGPTRDKDQILVVLTRLFGYLTALSSCDTPSSVITTTVGVLLTHVSQEHIDMALGLMNRGHLHQSDEIVQQGLIEIDGDQITAFRDQIKKFQFMTASVDEVPCFHFVKKGIILLVFAGLKPSGLTPEGSGLRHLVEGWERVAPGTFGHMQLLDAFLAVVDYVLEVIDVMMRGGSVSDYLFPKSVADRFVLVQSRKVPFDNGQLEERFGMTDGEYEVELMTLSAELGKQVRSKVISPAQRAIYTSYKVNVDTYLSDVRAKVASAQLRKVPYSICFYGAPNTNKTTAVNMAIKTFGACTGVPVDAENQYFWKGAAEFQSGLDHRKSVIQIDDACNKKISPNTPEKSDVADITAIVNNQPLLTNQAEIDQKGVVYVVCDLLVMTTNVYHLNALQASNAPRSILRRIRFVEVRVKPQYTHGNGKEEYDYHKQTYTNGIPDPVHDVRFYDVIEDRRGLSKVDTTDWMCITEFMKIFVKDVQEHRAAQTNYLERHAKVREAMTCPVCKCVEGTPWCKCTVITDKDGKSIKVMDQPSVGLTSDGSVVPVSNIQPELWEAFDQFSVLFIRDLNLRITDFVERFKMPHVNKWLEWMILKTSLWMILQGLKGFRYYKLSWFRKFQILFLMMFSVIGWSFITEHVYFSLFLFVSISCWLYLFLLGMASATRQTLTREIMRGILPTVSKQWFLIGGASFATGYQAVKLISRMYNTTTAPRFLPEGNLAPTTMEEVRERISEPDDWKADLVLSKLPSSVELKTATHEQICEKVLPNVLRFRMFEEGNEALRGNVFFLNHNTILFPLHSYRASVERNLGNAITFYRKTGTNLSRMSTYFVNPIELKYPDGGQTDFIMLTVTKSLPLRDMTDLLPDTFFTSKDNCVHTMLSRDLDEQINVRTFMSRYSDKVNNGSSRGLNVFGPGSHHVVDKPTRNGDCMGVTVRRTQPCFIAGFHMGGSASEHGKEAISFTVTKSMVEEALKKRPNKVTGEGEEVFIPRAKICSVELDGVVDSVRISLEEPHDRSVSRFVPKSDSLTPPMVDIYGEDPSYRHKYYSKVEVSPLSKFLEEAGMPNKWGKPHFKANRNYADYLIAGIHGAKDVDPYLLQECMNDYLRPMPDIVKRVNYPRQKPLTLDAACNGVPGNKFMRQINEKTAGGYGFPGFKSEYLEVSYAKDGRKILTPLKILSDEVSRLSEKLYRGEMVCPIVKNSLKDEPTLEPEYNNGKEKVRVFNIMNMAYNIIGRQLFLPVISFLSEFPIESELFQNCNVTTPEWEQIASHLLDFNDSQVLEGDFSKMDVRLSGQMIRAAGSCMIHVAAILGYDSDSLRAMEAFVCDAALSFWMFNGLLFSVDGWNTSGNVLTILFNGISNSLLHRLCYFKHWRSMYLKTPDPFRSHVHFGSVGDDSLGSTDLHWFNMELLKKYFDEINMKYTTANKTDEIVPFIRAEDATFCKRRFRYEPRVKQRVAPLAVDSVYKSLHCLHKPVLDDLSITCGNVDGALRELARHDEETFNYHREIILGACKKLGILHMLKYANWNYQDWWKEFCRIYYKCPMSPIEEEDSLEYSISSDECVPENLLVEEIERGCTFPLQKSLEIHMVTNVKIVNFRRWLWILLLTILAQSIDLSAGSYSIFQISKLMQEERIGDQAQTLNFGDAQRTWISGMETGVEPSMAVARTTDTNDGFFERPVRIATYDWIPGQALDAKFNPWKLFFEDSRVINRLAHFRNLKCELVVKFQINGNPFYYGRLIASYVPLHNVDTSTKFDEPADLVEASQRPHVYLNPTESEGGDIVCPFIWPKNALRIRTSEWRKMGIMILGTLNELRHANESTDSLTVNVYAYARNVEVDTPTSQLPNTIIPQGDEIVPQADEYTGVLSAPAHTLANWAGKLADAPIIGKYARATQLVASAVGGVAQLFGFSRPRQVNESNVAIVRFQSSLASTNCGDTSQTLALDSKKEITIDPSVTGAGPEDPMAIVPIAMRESFLTTFDWNGTSPEDSCIFSCRVRPMIGQVGNNDYKHIIPAAWVAAPFQYWTGSMKFRIQVVCSKFHRGRLRVVWDPEDYSANKLTSYNLNYSSIVDITECTDQCYQIGWGQEKSYMRVGEPRQEIPNCFASGLLTGTDQWSNGTLNIFVVNKLTAPSVEEAKIQVNVFASMCDDFELACPKRHSRIDNFTPVNNLPVLVPEENPVPPEPPVSEVVDYTGQPVGLLWGSPASYESTDVTVQSLDLDYGQIVMGTGVKQLELLAYGGPGGSTPDITLTWVNNGASAVDIEITIAGVSAITALAPQIGATSSTTVPKVSLFEGRNYIQIQTNISGSIRPTIQAVTTTLEAGMYVSRYSPSQIYDPDTGVLINGGTFDAKVQGYVGVDHAIAAPMDVVNGSRATLNVWDGATLNGVTYNNPNSPPADNRGYRPLWGPMNGGTKTLAVTAAEQNGNLFEAKYQHVFFLRKTLPRIDPIVPQADEITGTEGVNPSANAPICEDDQPVRMGPEVLGVGPMNSVFFGEQISSIRQVLKRYCAARLFVVGIGKFRIQLAHDANVVDPILTAPGATQQNYYALGVYEWFTSAFVCIRGGYRYKVFPRDFNGNTVALMAHRREFDNGATPQFAEAAGTYQPFTGFSGVAMCLPNDQSILEFEVPYYSNFRFYPGRSKIFEDPGNNIEREVFEIFLVTKATASVMMYSAVAEDFSTSFFLCTPIVDSSGTGGIPRDVGPGRGTLEP